MDIFTTIGPAVSGLLEVATDVITWALANPIIQVFFAGSLIGLGITMFTAAKRAI